MPFLFMAKQTNVRLKWQYRLELTQLGKIGVVAALEQQICFERPATRLPIMWGTSSASTGPM